MLRTNTYSSEVLSVMIKPTKSTEEAIVRI
jgi:hypothetical protein